METIESAYQCRDNCTVFITIGLPNYCPHCGSTEVYEIDKDTTRYETVDEYYENYENTTVD